MFTDIEIKNFRIFDQEGICVPFRPLTILTGCNNSGKSSISKALCLLKDFCQQLESDYDDGKTLRYDRYKIDFHKKPNSIMGSLNLVLHNQNYQEENKDNTTHDSRYITFEIVVESSLLLQDVILHLEFGAIDGDELNNGYLHSFSIRTLDDKIIVDSKDDGKTYTDFSIVKRSLLFFLYGQHIASKWQGEVSYSIAASIELDGGDIIQTELNNSMRCIIDTLGATSLVYLLEWQVSHCLQTWRDGATGAAHSVLKGNVDNSFITNSPILDVYCYFPCFETLKDLEKDNIRKHIFEVIDSRKDKISQLDVKIIKLFLDSFEKSEFKTLHEYISFKENQQWFNQSYSFSFGKSKFSMPSTYWHREVNSIIYDENDLPEKANWVVHIMAMDIINQLITNTEKTYLDYDEINGFTYYYAERYLDEYFQRIIEDIFVKIMPGSLSYTPTTIVLPQRMYSLEEDGEFTNILKKYFETKRLFISTKGTNYRLYNMTKGENEYTPCTFINKWLNQLGIAHHVTIDRHAGGYGVTIQLYDDENDTTGMMLADKGLGVLHLFVILLNIEIAIMEKYINEELHSYYTDGFSDSIINVLRTYNQLHPCTVALEEPECHLHPSYQSQFADIINDAYKQYGIHFIIESHSEYFIRKLQLNVSEKKMNNNEVSLLYVNSPNRPSYISAITDIGIESDGTLKNEFGSGFFDESIRLSKELFKVKEGNDEE